MARGMVAEGRDAGQMPSPYVEDWITDAEVDAAIARGLRGVDIANHSPSWPESGTARHRWTCRAASRPRSRRSPPSAALRG